MSAGACGIDCGVCRLKVRGLCSPCGAATGEAAREKLEAQQRIFQGSCPVLRCARDHGIPYCLRDCTHFPCESFRRGPYPFSEGFLQMQQRRRSESRPPTIALKDMLRWKEEEIDSGHWEELRGLDPGEVCRRALAAYDEKEASYRVRFLDRSYRVSPSRRSVVRAEDGAGTSFRFAETSFAEALVLVLYLLRAKELPLSGRQQTERELPGGGTFFQGPHELPRAPLLERFGGDPPGLLQAGLALGAKPLAFGDAAFRLQALPRVPVDYILWAEDEEFPARLTLAFDSSAAEHLPLDVLWALIHIITVRLLEAG
ncbi:MAG: DUF3786 domain-containing protein [bacterium]